jgi:hypothetical protein
MENIFFKKEDFAKGKENEYQITFKTEEIGEGSNLIVERLGQNGQYEIIQAPIRRFNDTVSIIWDHPFDGRIQFDK